MQLILLILISLIAEETVTAGKVYILATYYLRIVIILDKLATILYWIKNIINMIG